jgi:uncharacterized protein
MVKMSEELTKDQLVALLQANHRHIAQFGVRKLGLFGSFVRKAQTSASDVDLLVEFDQAQKTFDNFMQLSFFLEELLGRPVELVTPESLSPYIGPHITREVEYVALTH